MGFNKNTVFTIDKDGIEIIDGELIKTAAFELPNGINYDPDFLYMWVKAVSSGETWGANKNNDWFPREELKSSYKTFLSAHVFKNHENKQIENAIGDVLDSVWNDDMDCVKLLIRVDSKIAPSIVRGFKQGYMTDVSMGCRVDHSVCSICGNVAKTPREYCEHIKFERGKIYEDGRKVYEINIGPKFHDISAVLNGAEKTAKVTGIYVYDQKLANSSCSGMEKAASFAETFVDRTVEKTAGTWKTSYDIFPESLMSKKAYANKIAEIKKDLDGKVLSMSEDAVVEELANDADIARDALRMCYENYWDEDRCREIAQKLSELAEERGTSKESIFAQFLNAVTFTGCELAPKEFECIFEALFGFNGAGKQTYQYTDEDENDIYEECSRIPGFLSVKSMIEPAIMAMRSRVNPSRNIMGGLTSPKRGISIIAAMPASHHNIGDSDTHSIIDMLRDTFKERSVTSPSILSKTVTVKPNRHMFIMKSGSGISDMLNGLYMAYQSDRVNNFMSPSYIKFAEDFNSDMEKTAGVLSFFKPNAATVAAGTVGIPLVMGYSKYQRSRIAQGKNVSSFNHYVANNPGSAVASAVILAAPTHRGYKHLVADTAFAKQSIDKAYNNMVNDAVKVKLADVINYNMEKVAKEMNISERKVVDDAIYSVYNKDNNGEILKMASILSASGRDDAADYILNGNNLNQSDLDNYVYIAKTALTNYKINELEKQADEMIRFGCDSIPEGMDFESVVIAKFASRKK